ncbi:MAG: flavin reductase family protein [Betaproteobacteria bacterium]|nr:flavin reductase family protein [Betaproteobacteria bacterium]
MDGAESAKLRAAFGAFMTGVTVVAARRADGAPVGFTANSYTSVSMSPPLILVCPARALSTFSVFENCAHFAVSVLAESQRGVANIFAGKNTGRFGCVEWREDAAGAPLIDGAAAFFSCATHERVAAGDHLVLIGRVLDFGGGGEAGLGYFNGGYFSLSLERRAAESAGGLMPVAGVIVEYGGRILLQQTSAGMVLPRAAAAAGAPEAARALLDKAGMRAELGPVYSVFTDKRAGEHAAYYRVLALDDDACGLGEYYGADDIGALRFASPPAGDMMRRYAAESKNGVFGLYVGDEEKGDIHQTEKNAAGENAA